jgi:hypothetical protein
MCGQDRSNSPTFDTGVINLRSKDFDRGATIVAGGETMSPAALLARVGHILFGDVWKAGIAHAAGVSMNRVDDWSKGNGEPPPAVWRDLAGFIQERERMLPPLRASVLRFADSPHEIRAGSP